MSVTNVKRLRRGGGGGRARGTRASVAYQLYGTQGTTQWRENLARGTTRAAAITCDLESPEAFVERAEYLADRHNRQVEVRSLIHSFNKDELNPDDPQDVQRVNDLGYMFANELHPNSDVLVVTHTDSQGGHPHNHITVINHDNVTNKALQGNHLHWQVAKVNDRLMEREGQRVEERGKPEATKYWEWQRENTDLSDFDRDLGDRVEDALIDPRSVDADSYREVLAESGIELREKVYKIKASADGSTPEYEAVGWTYVMRDESGPRPRIRRRAASRLAEQFTKVGAQRWLDDNASRPTQAVRATQAAILTAQQMEPMREAANQRAQQGLDAQRAREQQARERLQVELEAQRVRGSHKQVHDRSDMVTEESSDDGGSGSPDARETAGPGVDPKPRGVGAGVREDQDADRGSAAGPGGAGGQDADSSDVKRARRGIATAQATRDGGDSTHAATGQPKPTTQRDRLLAHLARERATFANGDDRERDSGPER